MSLKAGAPGYPAAMWALARTVGRWASPPPTLYLRGTLPSRPGVAVVGTRRASEAALALTDEMCCALARMGCAIWSGGALGIDAAAHRASLAAGVATVVVTAGGLQSCYPAEHATLFRRILDGGGALLSLQADGQPRQRHHFLQRNAIMAALTRATLLIQAPHKSGARSTCAAARRLGRPLLVVPGAPYDELGAGCAAELVRGARPVCSPRQLCEAVRAILAGESAPPSAGAPAHTLPPMPAAPSAAAPAPLPEARSTRSVPLSPPVDLDAAGRALLAALEAEPIHVDELTRRCGLPAAKISAALLELRLLGLAIEGPPGHYRAA